MTEGDTELKRLLRKQTELLSENNRLLKRLHRYNLIAAWIKVLWIAVLIGLPFALYFYVLEPYFAAFGASYEQFQSGIQELPGLKALERLLDFASSSEHFSGE